MNFTSLPFAACRMRSSPWDMLSRRVSPAHLRKIGKSVQYSVARREPNINATTLWVPPMNSALPL
jgi:hypothetical protein